MVVAFGAIHSFSFCSGRWYTNYRVPVLQPWLTKIIEKLPADQQAEFKGKAQTAIKYLIGKIKDLQL